MVPLGGKNTLSFIPKSLFFYPKKKGEEEKKINSYEEEKRTLQNLLQKGEGVSHKRRRKREGNPII